MAQIQNYINNYSLHDLSLKKDQIAAEEIKENKDLQMMIANNLERFQILSEPLLKIPDQISLIKTQLQAHTAVDNELFQKLKEQDQNESNSLASVRKAISKKKELQEYILFRNLAPNLQSQVHIDRQLGLLDQVNPIYDELISSHESLSDDVRTIVKQNNSQITKVFKAILFDFKKYPQEYYQQIARFIPQDVVDRLVASLISERLQTCNNYNELTRNIQFCYDCVKATGNVAVALNPHNSQQILECITQRRLLSEKDKINAEQFCQRIQEISNYNPNNSGCEHQDNLTQQYSAVCFIKQELVKLTEKEMSPKFKTESLEVNASCLQEFIAKFFVEKIEKVFAEISETVVKELFTQLNATLPFDARFHNLLADCKFTQSDEDNFNHAKNTLDAKKTELCSECKDLLLNGDQQQQINLTFDSITTKCLEQILSVYKQPFDTIILYSSLAQDRLCATVNNPAQYFANYLYQKMTANEITEPISRKVFTDSIDYACSQLINVYSNISDMQDLKQQAERPHRLVVDKIQQFFETEELQSLTSFVLQPQRKDMLIIRQKYLTYEQKSMIIATNEITFDPKQFDMTVEQVKQMSNCRRFFSYAIQLSVPRYLDQFKSFMASPLTKEDQARILLTLIVLIIVVTSLICENEMDALTQKVTELLEIQQISEDISLEHIQDCFSDFYQ